MAFYRRLGELLLAAGTITQEELDHGLALQKEQKGRLGEVLIKNGIITEDQLIEALQMQLGIEYIDLSKINIPTELAGIVPKNIAKQYQVVPVRIVKDEIYLAMSDPLNFYAIEEVRKAVRKRVVPMVAQAAQVERAIQVLYGNEGAAKAIEEMKREAAASGETTAAPTNAFVSNQLGDDSANSAPTIRLVNSIIERAITERASDVHLEPHESEMLVRMRVDGMMRDILTVPRDLQSSVISRLKIMSGLDIAERRIPQDGRFNVRIRDKDIDLRVSTLPTVFGEKIVARLLDKSGGNITKESIGLTGHDLELFDKLMRCRSGVLLIVGPTGSGKSTTMYAMMGELNRREVNLVTLEDPVEYHVDGVNQVQINEKQGLTFASGLRSILRQDPDRRDRHARRHHRPRRALDHPYQRRRRHHRTSRGHRRGALSCRQRPARRHLPASGAPHLPEVPQGLHPRRRGAEPDGSAAPRRSQILPRRGLPRLLQHRLSRPYRRVRDAACQQPRAASDL